MPHVTANGIQIEYDAFGDRSSPALLLIAGNGAQLIVWDAGFCERLAKTGLYVIRFDNRDVGLSTKFDEAGMPDLMAAFQAAMLGQKVESAYTLDDMADDAVGLLDAMGIGKAHICGASMGGMIAQIVAYRHPGRILTLTSMMSTTGNPALPFGRQDAIAALLAPAPAERGAYVEHYVNVWRRIWSPGFPFEEENVRKFMEKSYDRCYCPQGMARQNAAIIAGGDRRPKLASIKAPTLVIHGADDPLIPVAGGKDTAESIPGAKLLIVEGMGHDMPQGVWAQIVDAVAKHTAQAGG